MSVDYHLALADHYKAVRSRLNAGPRAPLPEPPPPPPEPEPPPPPDPMEGAVCPPDLRAALHAIVVDDHGLTWAQVVGPTRTARYVAARMDVYAVLRGRGWSFPRIGNFMNGRDHTTIMYSIRRHQKRKETNA